MWSLRRRCWVTALLCCTLRLGFASASAGAVDNALLRVTGYRADDGLSPLERGDHPPDSPLVMQLKLPQCREDCQAKFTADESSCLQHVDCTHCLNRCTAIEHNTIPDDRPPPPRLPAQQLATGRDTVRLHADALVRDRSLVSADIRWPWPAGAWQRTGGHCLVTWDVLGGGLMGNLLTDAPEVQLTLWPQTVYHIQVTCKCKENGLMFKSQPLTIDTSEAIDADHSSTTTTTSTTMSTTTSALPTAGTEIATTSSPSPPPAPTATTLEMWRTSETPPTAGDRTSNAVVSKPHKDPFALLRKHQLRKTVHHNEILPHQQRRIATSPSMTLSTDAARQPGRLSLGLLLAVTLAGTAMLGAWLLLLRRCDAVADRATKMQSAQKTTTTTGKGQANIGRDQLELWIGAADEADEEDALAIGAGTAIRTCDGGTVDVPLMRVIHV